MIASLLNTAFAAALSSLLCSCTLVRLAVNNLPSADDMDLFPCREFAPATETYPLQDRSTPNLRLDSLMLNSHTRAFIVIGNGAVRYSFNAFDTPCCLFSATKSVISALTGIAVSHQMIENDSCITRYLPFEAPNLSRTTVAELLDMRGGLRENNLQTALIYYSDNLNAMIERARPTPDHSFAYSNLSTQMLCTALDKATDNRTDQLFEHYLWRPLNPSHKCRWSMDSQSNRTLRAFGGLEMTAADAALFGLLYMNGGISTNGQEVIAREWVEKTINPAHNTIDRNGAIYSRQWYVLRPAEEFFAKGLFGQYIYVNRACSTVIVRLGSHETDTDWIALFRSIADQQQSLSHLSESVVDGVGIDVEK